MMEKMKEKKKRKVEYGMRIILIDGYFCQLIFGLCAVAWLRISRKFNNPDR